MSRVTGDTFLAELHPASSTDQSLDIYGMLGTQSIEFCSQLFLLDKFQNSNVWLGPYLVARSKATLKRTLYLIAVFFLNSQYALLTEGVATGEDHRLSIELVKGVVAKSAIHYNFYEFIIYLNSSRGSLWLDRGRFIGTTLGCALCGRRGDSLDISQYGWGHGQGCLEQCPVRLASDIWSILRWIFDIPSKLWFFTQIDFCLNLVLFDWLDVSRSSIEFGRVFTLALTWPLMIWALWLDS